MKTASNSPTGCGNQTSTTFIQKLRKMSENQENLKVFPSKRRPKKRSLLELIKTF